MDREPEATATAARCHFVAAAFDYGSPSRARLSEADEAEHGRKLYFLFAGAPSDQPDAGDELIDARHLYMSLNTDDPQRQELPVGFTIVKQSWTTKQGRAPESPTRPKADPFSTPPPIDWVETEDGQALHADRLSDLYVLYKAGPPDTPGTDRGWVYGTLDPNGSVVTSGGLVEQCMDCHVAAKHERLFGLQPTSAPFIMQAQLERARGHAFAPR